MEFISLLLDFLQLLRCAEVDFANKDLCQTRVDGVGLQWSFIRYSSGSSDHWTLPVTHCISQWSHIGVRRENDNDIQYMQVLILSFFCSCSFGDPTSTSTDIDWVDWGIDIIPYMVVVAVNSLLIVIAVLGILLVNISHNLSKGHSSLQLSFFCYKQRAIKQSNLKLKVLIGHFQKDWRILGFFIYYWITLAYVAILLATITSNPLKTRYYDNAVALFDCLLGSSSKSEEEKCWDNRGDIAPHYGTIIVSTLLSLFAPTMAFLMLGFQKHFIQWWYNWFKYIKKNKSITFSDEKISFLVKNRGSVKL